MRRACLVGLLACLTVSGLPAQEPPPPIPPEVFRQRRLELMKRVETGIVVVRGLGQKGAGLEGFVQDDDFYYLTGVAQADAALVLFPEEGKDLLLVQPFSRFTATWDGERVVPSEAHAKRLHYDEIRPIGTLPRLLRKALTERAAAGKATRFWTAGVPRGTRGEAEDGAAAPKVRRFERPPADAAVFAANLAAMFPDVQLQGIERHVAAMRGVKGAEEIACIEAATTIACAGIAEAIKSTEPGVYQFQIAAAARYVFQRMGAGPDAYAAIVGAGANGCVLHYSANSKKVGASELIVMDFAPTVHGYCSDVTRTFPTSGRFTPEQRKLVQDVHDVQQILIAMVAPGSSIGAISARCSQELAQRGYRTFHGPSHHVGLHVHDFGGDTLEPGMVITVEPGAYLVDREMGCRIEDVILVTADGHRNLSGHLPSTPDGIEALMQQAGVQQVPVGVPQPAKKKDG